MPSLMRQFCLAAAVLLSSSGLAISASFSPINATNTPLVAPFVTVDDQLGLPLDSGTTDSPPGAGKGDGDLFLIGALSDTTSTTLTDPDPNNWPLPDWNSFLALTGVGSNNHAADNSLNSTMGDGDSLGLHGFYSIGVTLNDTDHPDLPASGTWLVQRFYNDKTVASSTHYTTVAIRSGNSLANTTLNQPGAAASLDLDAVRQGQVQAIWEGGVPFQTNLLNPDFVPEPSTALLALLGVGFLLRRRRS